MKDYPRLDESISFLSNLLIQMFFIISKAIYFAHRLAIFDWITLKRTTSPPRKKRCLLNCIENTANILDTRFLETRAYLIKNICAIQKFKFSPKFNDLANVSPSLEAFNYIKICSSKSTYFFFVKGVWGSFRLLRAPLLSVFIRVHFALLTWNFT